MRSHRRHPPKRFRPRRKTVSGAIFFGVALVVAAEIQPTGLDLDRATDALGRMLGNNLKHQANAGSLQGHARVIDGDTLEIQGERVRLFGIDAPESGQPCKRSDGSIWYCGQAATQALKTLIGSQKVACEIRDLDSYGRQVSICRKGEIELNRAMTSKGFAIAYREFSRRYVQDERQARNEKRGIWATDFLRPSQWRNR